MISVNFGILKNVVAKYDFSHGLNRKRCNIFTISLRNWAMCIIKNLK